MTDGRLALQKKIYAALTGDATLMSKITGVFDFIPDNQPYAFVQIGEVQHQPFDTHDFSGFDGEITVHTWHRPGSRGRAPIHAIQDDIYRIMHKNIFSITDYVVVSMRFIFSEILVDPDAVTYHGVTRFRILMGGNQ